MNDIDLVRQLNQLRPKMGSVSMKIGSIRMHFEKFKKLTDAERKLGIKILSDELKTKQKFTPS